MYQNIDEFVSEKEHGGILAQSEDGMLSLERSAKLVRRMSSKMKQHVLVQTVGFDEQKETRSGRFVELAPGVEKEVEVHGDHHQEDSFPVLFRVRGFEPDKSYQLKVRSAFVKKQQHGLFKQGYTKQGLVAFIKTRLEQENNACPPTQDLHVFVSSTNPSPSTATSYDKCLTVDNINKRQQSMNLTRPQQDDRSRRAAASVASQAEVQFFGALYSCTGCNVFLQVEAAGAASKKSSKKLERPERVRSICGVQTDKATEVEQALLDYLLDNRPDCFSKHFIQKNRDLLETMTLSSKVMLLQKKSLETGAWSLARTLKKEQLLEEKRLESENRLTRWNDYRHQIFESKDVLIKQLKSMMFVKRVLVVVRLVEFAKRLKVIHGYILRKKAVKRAAFHICLVVAHVQKKA